jgi:hypothetical protein
MCAGDVRAALTLWRSGVLDLIFVAMLLAFFGLSFGYAAFCDRL